MALTITRSRIKEKCGITDTSRDATIDNLILEFVPVIEFALTPSALADPAVGIQSTLNLGATEVIAGELLAQLAREPGASDLLEVGDIRLAPPSGASIVAVGWQRLRPFLKPDPGGRAATGVAGGVATE
ncbi:MAG: hypothetical protein ACOYON_11830 [Fimbriimonas sp.]